MNAEQTVSQIKKSLLLYLLSASSSSKYLMNWGMRVLKTPIICDPDQDLNCLLQVCRRVWVSGSRNPTLLTQSWVCGARSPWGTQAFSCFQASVRCNNIKVIDVTGWCELTRSEQWRTQSRWCFFSFFLAVKWFQIQHLKEHIGFPSPWVCKSKGQRMANASPCQNKWQPV